MRFIEIPPYLLGMIWMENVWIVGVFITGHFCGGEGFFYGKTGF